MPLLMSFKETEFDFDVNHNILQAFRWKKIAELQPDDVTFPADKAVVLLLKSRFNN